MWHLSGERNIRYQILYYSLQWDNIGVNHYLFVGGGANQEQICLLTTKIENKCAALLLQIIVHYLSSMTSIQYSYLSIIY